ncbi:MAG TPA: N-acetylmuramic acid 6-phosphate etherase [Bryobacteraceae bacterium]
MFEHLLTEQSHPGSGTLHRLPTPEILNLMNAADAEVAGAVRREIPKLAAAVDGIAAILNRGGHLAYIGAGTSGRLGVLDAAECPPTFHTPPDLVQAVIAGGDSALRRAVEGAEDDMAAAPRDLAAIGFSRSDVLAGISASGRTPYVLSAMAYAKSLGATTCGISCTQASPLSAAVDYPIEPWVGPEVLTGSTRLRAGTATKLVLNMLSTAVMIRLGYVYGNLMINVQPTNAKLEDRARRIIQEAAGVSFERAAELLELAGRDVRTAIVMHKKGVSREEAGKLLKEARGRLGEVL